MRVSCQFICVIALLVALSRSAPLLELTSDVEDATKSAGRLSNSLFGRSPHTIALPIDASSLLNVHLDQLVGDSDLKLVKRGFGNPFGAFQNVAQSVPGPSSLSGLPMAGSMLPKMPFAGSIPNFAGLPGMSSLPTGGLPGTGFFKRDFASPFGLLQNFAHNIPGASSLSGLPVASPMSDLPAVGNVLPQVLSTAAIPSAVDTPVLSSLPIDDLPAAISPELNDLKAPVGSVSDIPAASSLSNGNLPAISTPVLHGLTPIQA